jgi:hypothetical protein
MKEEKKTGEWKEEWNEDGEEKKTGEWKEDGMERRKDRRMRRKMGRMNGETRKL